MFETLQRLYNEGKLTLDKLENAVIKEWITEDEKQLIVNGN